MQPTIWNTSGCICTVNYRPCSLANLGTTTRGSASPRIYIFGRSFEHALFHLFHSLESSPKSPSTNPDPLLLRPQRNSRGGPLSSSFQVTLESDECQPCWKTAPRHSSPLADYRPHREGHPLTIGVSLSETNGLNSRFQTAAYIQNGRAQVPYIYRSIVRIDHKYPTLGARCVDADTVVRACCTPWSCCMRMPYCCSSGSLGWSSSYRLVQPTYCLPGYTFRSGKRTPPICFQQGSNDRLVDGVIPRWHC